MTKERYLYPDVDAIALFQAIREQVAKGIPEGAREQMEAAFAESVSTLGAIASLSGSAVELLAIADAAEGSTERWLLRRLLEVPLGLALGDIKGCEHVGRGRGPLAVLAMAWSRRIICLSRECFQRYLDDLRPQTERDCDRCGANAPPGGLRMVMAQFGHTILVAGICPACAPSR